MIIFSIFLLLTSLFFPTLSLFLFTVTNFASSILYHPCRHNAIYQNIPPIMNKLTKRSACKMKFMLVNAKLSYLSQILAWWRSKFMKCIQRIVAQQLNWYIQWWKWILHDHCLSLVIWYEHVKWKSYTQLFIYRLIINIIMNIP